MTISAHTLTQYDLPQRPYYDRRTYLKSDFKEGVLRTETGRRVIILPQELVLGVHQAIEYETGRAWNLVAHLCGRRWGERLLVTVREEWRHFHRSSLDHVDFDFFQEWLKGYFRFHGWGRLEMDFSMERKGLVEFHLYDSILDRLLESLPGGYVNEIFAGLLASWISWFSGEELDCLEIASPQLGAEYARFVVGLTPRIEAARKKRSAGADLEAMMQALMETE
jgi:uncharacterized protein